MSNDDLKGLEPKANKTNYVGSDSEEGRLQHAADNKRQIGVLSASMLIFNRVIGTGIFATPGSILALLGSPGLALIIWVVGSIIAAAGTAVYLEWGTGIPKNGGEKNYLEFIYRKPKFLVTGIYASYILLMGWASGNSVVFGEYILHAANTEVDRWNQRGIGLACITTAFLIHGCALKWGLRLQNALGIIKLFIVFIMIICGFVALGGHLKTDEKPNNFKNAFEGTTGSAYGVVTALYNVIWSFVGYSNANYALSETRNPVRTLKIAAPTAIISVSIIYILVNIAYFAAVSRLRSLPLSVLSLLRSSAMSWALLLSVPCLSLSLYRLSETSSVSSSLRVVLSRNSVARVFCLSPVFGPATDLSTPLSRVFLSTGLFALLSSWLLLLEMPTTSSSSMYSPQLFLSASLTNQPHLLSSCDRQHLCRWWSRPSLPPRRKVQLEPSDQGDPSRHRLLPSQQHVPGDRTIYRSR
uniref:High-affinity methionine permease n=1 Tax=Fusarium oxysporum (strain Fo5176) TaxID=660025 RepID=A0A0D2XKL1_FUSOF